MNTTPTRSRLHAAINAAFKRQETRLNYHLDDHTRASVVDYWTHLVEQAAEKFIRGGKEHNPTQSPDNGWFHVNARREVKMEIVDLIHYLGQEEYLRLHPNLNTTTNTNTKKPNITT